MRMDFVGRGLQIERDGDTLIVRAETAPDTKVLGAVVAFFCVLLLTFTVSSGNVLVVLFGVWFAEGVFLMLPWVITTTFDLRSRLVVYSWCFGNRSLKTNRYAFEEIAGIAQIGDFPCLKLKGRIKLLTLVRNSIAPYAAEPLIEAISAATGLAKLDYKRAWWLQWWWWW